MTTDMKFAVMTSLSITLFAAILQLDMNENFYIWWKLLYLFFRDEIMSTTSRKNFRFFGEFEITKFVEKKMKKIHIN